MQRSGARERRKAAEQEHRGASRTGEGQGPGRAAEQRSRAGMQGRKQGSKAAGQGRAAIEIQLADGHRGANIYQKLLQLSHWFVNIGKKQFANGCRGAGSCQQILSMLTFSGACGH